jgi:hypothetical protein
MAQIFFLPKQSHDEAALFHTAQAAISWVGQHCDMSIAVFAGCHWPS